MGAIGLVTLVFATVLNWFNTVTMTVIGLCIYTTLVWLVETFCDWVESLYEHTDDIDSDDDDLC